MHATLFIQKKQENEQKNKERMRHSQLLNTCISRICKNLRSFLSYKNSKSFKTVPNKINEKNKSGNKTNLSRSYNKATLLLTIPSLKSFTMIISLIFNSQQTQSLPEKRRCQPATMVQRCYKEHLIRIHHDV